MLHSRRRLASLFVVALTVSACVDQPIELLGERTGAITGGSSYTGHPAVGRIRIGNSGLCTGSLVGERTVLTAAHCLKDGQTHRFILDTGETITAAAAHRHPQWKGDGTPYDIGVLILSSKPTTVKPLVVSTTAPSVGMPITLIGYGATLCQVVSGQIQCTSDANVKRRATNSISRLYNIEFRFDGTGSTCKGDSGGPAFATVGGREVQIGVTSRGAMPCGQSAIDTRVDAFVDWIRQVANGDVNDGKDSTAPTATITSPAAGATVDAGQVVVKANASDDTGVVNVELRVDGQVAGQKGGAPYEFTVTLTAGQHTLEVVAKDAANNEGKATATITVTDPPTDPEPTDPKPTDPKPTDPKPTTPQPGEYGAECASASDCKTGLCGYDSTLDKRFCTQGCDPNATPCPGQSDCLPTNAPDKHVCGAPSLDNGAPKATPDGAILVGSCAMAPSASLRDGAWLGLALLGLLLVHGRRRRRRRRSRR